MPDLLAALQIAEDIYNSGETVAEKLEGHKYLASSIILIEAVKCARSVALERAKIEELVKMVNYKERLMLIHLQQAIREMSKPPVDMIRRFKSRIPLFKKKPIHKKDSHATI